VAEVGGYLRIFGAQARAQVQYRWSFAIELVSSVLFGAADVVAVFVVFHAAGLLGGFDRAEGLLIAALSSGGFALADLAIGNIDTIRNYVRTGQLDTVLLRPLGAFGQLVAMDFAPRRAGRVLVSGSLIVAAAHWSGVRWTPGRVLLAVLTPVGGGVLFGAVFVATATVAFWWIDSGEFGNAFTYGGRDFTAFPMTVYQGFFRRLLGYGLGYAFAGYYPALGLLDRPDPLGGPAWFAWATVPVGLIAALVARQVWRLGLRQYRSTGS
jgi:ABC-2 type transport system permease protein